MKSISLILSILFFQTIAFAQKADTLVKKLDSLSKKTGRDGFQNNNTAPGAYNDRTKITSSSYSVLLWSDYKQQVSAPLHINGNEWKKVGGFAALTGVLALADKPIQKTALRWKNNNQGLSNISKFVTNTGGIYESATLAAFGAYGFLFKNEKMKTTTFLASQAYLTGAGMAYILKTLSGRQRPSYYNANAVEANPTFRGPFGDVGKDANGKKLNSSFPSGHTVVAFSAATVYAMEYKDKPIVPIIAYSAASLIGLSRITENKHWATDVLVGAALGHLSGRQVVNNYHRYAKIKSTPKPIKPKRKKISYNVGYWDGSVMAGLKYAP